MNQFYSDAIYASYPNAVTINSDSIVFDSDNNVINIDEDVISNKISELKEAQPMRMLRVERDQLIATTDWRATVDYPGSDQAAWITYRQALRDLPANSTPSLDENGQLTGVTWPTPPE